jgi:hypothetical protein
MIIYDYYMSCLEDCNLDNTKEFSLCGLTLKGKVIECYDADTCKIALDGTIYVYF